MRLQKILSVVPACVCAMGVVSALPAMAQPAGALRPERVGEVKPEADGTQTRRVSVRNMAPDVMAFLLDPEHQPEPLTFSISRHNSSALSGDNAKELAEAFPQPKLDAGASIEKVEKEQNALLLRGTPEALDAWAKAIAELDKPLQQVVVEMQLMRVSPQALKALGVPTDAPGPHLLGGNMNAKMRDLLQTKQVKIVTAPRVLAISGLTAALESTTAIPARVAPLPDGDDKTKADAAAVVPLGRFWVWKSMGMAVRAIARPNDTIDMELAAGFSRRIHSELRDAPMSRPQGVSFLAQDGRSYLFYAGPNFESAPPKRDAANSPVPQPAQIAQPDAEGQIAIYIVQASIVRRAPIGDQILIAELIRQGRVEAAR